MILHLAEDEKFIDHVIDMFEQTNPNKNIYFIKLEGENSSLKFIKSNHKNIIADTINGEKYIHIINNLNNYDSVILHFLSKYKQEIVKTASKSIHFHWMCWGADLYNCVPQLQKQILIEKEKEKIKQNYKGVIGDIINSVFPHLWHRFYLKNKQYKPTNHYKKLIERINSISTVIPNEVDLVKRYLNNKIIYKPFKYLTIEGSLLKNDSPICNENNFLVGNSAHKSNNHINAFKKINSIISDELVYVPLSYGDKNYANKVIAAGNSTFNRNFHPITDFMPLDEYTKILFKCGNVIINSNRQQAIANIVIALWYGARIFLNTKNPTYHYFKSQGLAIYRTTQLKKYKSLLSFDTLAKINRPIIQNLYSRNNVIQETENLVDFLTQKHD